MDAPAQKRPIEIDTVMAAIAAAVQPFPKAALFELAELGFRTPFEQLLACVISIRTRDETTLAVAQQLFAVARTPQAILDLSPEEIDTLISPSTFHTAKAYQFREMAEQILAQIGEEKLCDFGVLTGLKGVGPKCANLVLAIACGEPRVSVDVHVHRVTNRWGYVQTRTPEQTMVVLEEILPKRHWVDINRLLVPFGKHICTGERPHCSTCPVWAMCDQVGVVNPR